MSYSKYYLYKKQVSNDNGVTWEDVTPLETAPSGESIGSYSTLEECSGSTPPPTPEPQYRTTSGSPYCSEYDKYVDVYSQVSYDSGSTWTTTATTPTMIEHNSTDCGYVPPSPSYSGQYLTFVAQESGTFTFSPSAFNTISYSLNSGSTWTQGNSVSVQSGDTVMWKGTMRVGIGIGRFSSTGNFIVEGNIMSLKFGDNFVGQTSLAGDTTVFYGLFSGCTTLTSAENMILPATTLTINCYDSMFKGCTSLTTAPTLPATTLANWCYENMFMGCTNLTTAPSLLATTLANSCYYQMFMGCTNLSSITCLATNISARNCTNDWVNGVSASGTFTKAASIWTTGDSGIPSGWTVVDAT